MPKSSFSYLLPPGSSICGARRQIDSKRLSTITIPDEGRVSFILTMNFVSNSVSFVCLVEISFL
jgi:hypothetical protein